MCTDSVTFSADRVSCHVSITKADGRYIHWLSDNKTSGWARRCASRTSSVHLLRWRCGTLWPESTQVDVPQGEGDSIFTLVAVAGSMMFTHF